MKQYNYLSHFFINAPYDLLSQKYLPLFIQYRLNPEIYFSPQLLDRWPEDEFKSLARELKQSGLKVTFHAPFYDLSPGAIDTKVRQVTQERLTQVFALVSLFNPIAIVAHLAYDDRVYRNHKEEWLKNSLETWEKVIPLAEKHQVYLNLENVFEGEPEIFLRLFENFSSPFVGICFDIGHVYAFTQSTLKDWEIIFPYINQLHLHDNHGYVDKHLGLGKGKIDFPSLFSLLKRYERYPILTLEPHTEEAFWDSLEYLQKLPAEIKAFIELCGRSK
ncbi:MAG: sugar phosphate isomerase/epimerase [Candidatus Desulfofervidaceae bacterium]|nr:sugar phosphate isomerase/epimerase [Candidatus Desulfofervidaceae bacterium]MDL1969436.1 sugar phosphate isomerase/epimerase [Candidatus Desulfofervidaceae bacterium]